MRILQVIGWLLILFTGMLAIYEIVQHMRQGGSWAFTDIGQFWTRLSPSSLNYMEGLVKEYVSVGLWNWFVRLPMILAAALAGALCLAIDYSIPRRTAIR
jgi:hypothetical protein